MHEASVLEGIPVFESPSNLWTVKKGGISCLQHYQWIGCFGWANLKIDVHFEIWKRSAWHCVGVLCWMGLEHLLKAIQVTSSSHCLSVAYWCYWSSRQDFLRSWYGQVRLTFGSHHANRCKSSSLRRYRYYQCSRWLNPRSIRQMSSLSFVPNFSQITPLTDMVRFRLPEISTTTNVFLWIIANGDSKRNTFYRNQHVDRGSRCKSSPPYPIWLQQVIPPLVQHPKIPESAVGQAHA